MFCQKSRKSTRQRKTFCALPKKQVHKPQAFSPHSVTSKVTSAEPADRWSATFPSGSRPEPLAGNNSLDIIRIVKGFSDCRLQSFGLPSTSGPRLCLRRGFKRIVVQIKAPFCSLTGGHCTYSVLISSSASCSEEDGERKTISIHNWQRPIRHNRKLIRFFRKRFGTMGNGTKFSSQNLNEYMQTRYTQRGRARSRLREASLVKIVATEKHPWSKLLLRMRACFGGVKKRKNILTSLATSMSGTACLTA